MSKEGIVWDIAGAAVRDRKKVEGYLKEGYEPFAVSSTFSGGETIWLRKEVSIEIHSEQTKPTKSRSRRVTPTAKG